MTIHYHGTPITPQSVMLRLAGRHFCVSFAAPHQVELCHQIGQSVMIDNGAYSIWRRTKVAKTDWSDYYEWLKPWVAYKTTWAVIPDVIDGSEHENDLLLREWPHGDSGAPVWHVHEPIERLIALCCGWKRVCIGSSGEYAIIGTPRWIARMTQAMNELWDWFRGDVTVALHMLRGMSLSGSIFPFASVDSSDVAQNHHRHGQNGALMLADKWDRMQNPAAWTKRPVQQSISSYEPFIAAEKLSS